MAVFTRVKNYYLRKNRITSQEITGLDSINKGPQDFKKSQQIICNLMNAILNIACLLY